MPYPRRQVISLLLCRGLAVALVLVLVLQPPAPLLASGAPWNASVRVSDASSFQPRSPIIGRGDAGDLHCTFVSTEGPHLDRGLKHAISTDINGTWSSPNILAAAAGPAERMYEPDYARIEDEAVWIVFARDRPAGAGTGICFVAYTEGSRTTGLPVPVDDGSPAGVNDRMPSATCAGDTVCVVWYEADSGRLRLNRSLDAGATWLSSDLAVADVYTISANSSPRLAFDPATGVLHIVWAWIGHILHSRSLDLGDSWTLPRSVSDPSASDPDLPDLVVTPDGILYVAWNDLRNGTDLDVYLSRSSDGGVSWLPAIKVNDETTGGNQFEPHLSAAGETVHAVFLCDASGSESVDIHYTRSLDEGTTWEHPDPRVNDVPNVVDPTTPRSLAIVGDDTGSAFVVWRDLRRVADIYCASNVDPLAAASPQDRAAPPVRLEQNVPNPFNPRTVLAFELPADGIPGADVSLQIFDARGRLVRTWHPGILPPGRHERAWDGRDEAGRPVAAGTYFYRLARAGFVQTRPMTLVR